MFPKFRLHLDLMQVQYAGISQDTKAPPFKYFRSLSLCCAEITVGVPTRTSSTPRLFMPVLRHFGQAQPRHFYYHQTLVPSQLAEHLCHMSGVPDLFKSKDSPSSVYISLLGHKFCARAFQSSAMCQVRCSGNAREHHSMNLGFSKKTTARVKLPLRFCLPPAERLSASEMGGGGVR